MKKAKNIFEILGVGQLILAVIYFLNFVIKKDFVNLVLHIVVLLILIADGFLLIYIADLGKRVDKIEKNTYFYDEKEKTDGTAENNEKELEQNFKPGEPIKIKNRIENGDTILEKEMFGIVVKKVDDYFYLIEVEGKKGEYYKVNKDDIKSFFD